MDVRVDIGTKQMPFTRDLLFSSTSKGGLSISNVLALGRFLYHRGIVAADFSYNPDVFKAGKGIVN